MALVVLGVLWFNLHQPITVSVFPWPCLLSVCVSVSTFLSFHKDTSHVRVRARPHPGGAHLNLITLQRINFQIRSYSEVPGGHELWGDTIQLHTQSIPCFEVIFSQLNFPHFRIFCSTVLNLDGLEIQGTCMH